jgi:hypothetical protein
MKKFTKLLAIALAAGSAFALSACGESKNNIGSSAYWNALTNSVNDLTSDSTWLTNSEVATYAISFKEGGNANYKVEYNLDDTSSAYYKTEFYATQYVWNSDSTDGYKTDKTEYVYVYKTTLKLSGKYTYLATGESKEFSDSVETISYFRSATNSLEPVYSKQVIKTTAPAQLIPTSIDTCYTVIDSSYETFYNVDCTKATINSYDATTGESNSVELNDINGTNMLYDANSLGLALRSFTFSSGTSYTFDTVVAPNGNVATYLAQCNSTGTLNAEDEVESGIITALNESSPSDYIFVGADNDGNVNYNYNQVTLSIVADLSGSSYSYWYADVSGDLNATRATMLKVSTPIYYNLGTLTYSLSSLNKVSDIIIVD